MHTSRRGIAPAFTRLEGALPRATIVAWQHTRNS